MTAFLLVLVSQLAPAPRAKPNLLKNPSFEEGPDVGLFAQAEGPSVPGWVVSRGNVDHVGVLWTAAHGSRSIDLHGSVPGAIRQSFPTEVGRVYQVTFAFAGNPDSATTTKRMAVSAAGRSAEFSFDTAGKTREAPGWVKKSWQFAATEKETTLEFSTLSTEDPGWGPIIDDVSVTEVD
jgi:choice-of-anchor C domain-containing protein